MCGIVKGVWIGLVCGSILGGCIYGVVCDGCCWLVVIG